MTVSLKPLVPALTSVAALLTHPAPLSGQTSPPGTWNIVPSPNAPPEPLGNTLLAVDALSPTDAWAVGFHHNPTYCTYCPAPLAMHWDGARWSLVETPTIPIPKVQLTSVAAVSSDDVWAVGYAHNPDCGLCGDTLIEHWDGTSWGVVPSPNPGWANLLHGVAASSATDVWAVGYRWNNYSTWEPLILHYDGATWTASDQSEHQYGQLFSVTALAEDDVWAVGVVGVSSIGIQGLALHWDGTSWTRLPIPTEPTGYIVLRGVSGAGSNDVWAVGDHKYENLWGSVLSSARTYRWDGSSWTKVLPGVFGQDSRMYGVDVVSSHDAWAVGGEPGPFGSGVAFRYVTVHWDGVEWSNVENPNKGVLYAVSASSSSDAWAVGWGMDSLGYSTGTHTLHYTAACYADCDSSGGLDIDDFVCFQTLFAISDPAADCDADGSLTIDDFICFQTAFAFGCE